MFCFWRFSRLLFIGPTILACARRRMAGITSPGFTASLADLGWIGADAKRTNEVFERRDDVPGQYAQQETHWLEGERGHAGLGAFALLIVGQVRPFNVEARQRFAAHSAFLEFIEDLAHTPLPS